MKTEDDNDKWTRIPLLENKIARSIVHETREQNGGSLRHAAPELKGNREILLEAMQQNGYALGDIPGMQTCTHVLVDHMCTFLFCPATRPRRLFFVRERGGRKRNGHFSFCFLLGGMARLEEALTLSAPLCFDSYPSGADRVVRTGKQRSLVNRTSRKASECGPAGFCPFVRVPVVSSRETSELLFVCSGQGDGRKSRKTSELRGRGLDFVTATMTNGNLAPMHEAKQESTLQAVEQHGHPLVHAAPECKSDHEIVHGIVKQNRQALEQMAPEHKRDRESTSEAVKESLLRYATQGTRQTVRSYLRP